MTTTKSRLTNRLVLCEWLLVISSGAMADTAIVPNGNLSSLSLDTTHKVKHAISTDKPQGWVLGIGLGIAPNPFVGDAETPVQPFPIFGYFGEKLTWIGPTLSYNLFKDKTKPIAFDAITNLRFEGFKEDQNDPQLTKLLERDTAFEAGFRVRAYMLYLSALADVSNKHKGHEFSFGANHRFRLTNKLGLGLNVATVWRSDRLNNYYYGVSAREATLERPEYEAGSEFNYRMGLKLDYKLNKHWVVMTNVNYDRLSSEIRNSPIVEEDYQISVMAAVIYKF